MTLLEGPDAAEQQRGNQYQIFGLRVLDPGAECAGIGGIKNHFTLHKRGDSSRKSINGPVVPALPGYAERNDTPWLNLD